MGWDDKIENKKDEAKGAAKEQLGKATDDEQMQREGKTDQTKSNLKQAGEKVKDAFRKDEPQARERRARWWGAPLYRFSYRAIRRSIVGILGRRRGR